MDGSTYHQATLDYIEDCRRRGLRPATIRYYEMVLRRFGRVTEITELRDLTVRLVRDFQDNSTTLAAGSVRGFLRALKTFSRWVADEGLLEDDRLSRLRLPRSDRRVIVAPTEGELLAVMRASAPLLRLVLALIIGTGLRISDVCGLEQVDFRPGELIVGRTKNRAGRVVPLDPVQARLLELSAGLDPRNGSHALFTSRGGRALSPDAVRHALTDARTRARVELKVTPHIVRHWHARDLAAHDTHERFIAARMGWQDHELLARYAPVAAAEVVRDTARYAPLVRLRDEGALDGLFPGSVLRGDAAQRSKNVKARPSLVWDRRSGVIRQS